MSKRKVLIGIGILVVLVIMILTIIRATQVSRFPGESGSWTAVCMNTENQDDGTWSGYLVYEGRADSLGDVYADVTVNGSRLYNLKMESDVVQEDHMSIVSRLVTGIFNKPYYSLYDFGSDPESLDIKIQWTEKGETKTEIIKYEK